MGEHVSLTRKPSEIRIIFTDLQHQKEQKDLVITMLNMLILQESIKSKHVQYEKQGREQRK